LKKTKVNGKAIPGDYRSNRRRRYTVEFKAVYLAAETVRRRDGSERGICNSIKSIKKLLFKIKNPALRRGHELSVVGEPGS
jgi:hypothetical protein